MIIIYSATESVTTAETVSSGQIRWTVGGSYRKFSAFLEVLDHNIGTKIGGEKFYLPYKMFLFYNF